MLKILILVFSSLFASSAFSSQVDTLYINGTIWTGVGTEKNEYMSVMTVKGGVIKYVGNTVPIGMQAQQTVDLQGKFLMHGFIDNHVHFMEGGSALASVDLRNTQTPKQFSQKIAQFSRNLKPGRWILNGNWDHENWGGVLPHKNWIDKDTPNTPVYVIRIDGHQALANSAALKLANIDRDTPNPEGGLILRDENGEATGLLKGNALNLVLNVIPHPSDDELMEQFSLAQEHALRLGLSKIHALTAYPTETTMLRTFMLARERKLLKIRAFVSTPIESWQEAAKVAKERGNGDELLAWGGVKGFIDGSLGARTAWFYESYADEKDYFGLPINDPEKLKYWMKNADQAGLSLSIHALGDRGIDTILIYLKEMAGSELSNRRFRIEHFQHPSEKAIAALAANGFIASMQPYHAIDDGRWAEQRIGSKRLATTYAFRSILDAGGLLTFGSDWPVAPLSPIDGVYAAVTRRTLDEQHPNGWIPAQKITVEEALTAYTVTNSYAFRSEDTSGTLAPGKFADFIILSDNPIKSKPEQIRDIVVLENYINGKPVFKLDVNSL